MDLLRENIDMWLRLPVETAITLMSDVNLNSTYWYHACPHAAFLINRMSCKTLQMKSPYQVLFGQNPTLQHLKVFGSVVYPLLRPYNDKKLQQRSAQCVFLGYVMGYKGVVCYNMHTKKLILSKHVIHDEEMFPCKHRVSSVATNQQQSCKVSQVPIMTQLPSISSTIQNMELLSNTENGSWYADSSSTRQFSHDVLGHNDTTSAANTI